MTRFTLLLLALCALIIPALAASPPSFCKCTCFASSFIIPLSPAETCSACHRVFCLGQGLPICKDAEDKDVFTTCFQRDSRKDQIVVLAFIAGTVGLLGWAAVRKILEKRTTMSGREPQQGYIAVGGDN